MNRFRPLLSVVLGLVLLVQGFAVAAAEYRSPAAVSGMASEQALPCHVQATQDEGTSSCCDANCPDMTTCALGHLAAASSTALDPILANEATSSEPIPSRSSSSPPLFLRPPIVSHA